jgi:hypothetical protein
MRIPKRNSQIKLQLDPDRLALASEIRIQEFALDNRSKINHMCYNLKKKSNFFFLTTKPRALDYVRISSKQKTKLSLYQK